MFRMRLSHRRVKSSERMLKYPARTMSSTPFSSSSAFIFSSAAACEPSVFALTTAEGMPAFAARSRA